MNSLLVTPTIVRFSCSVVSDLMDCMQHARLPCPSPTPGAYSNSCPSSQRCHPTTSSSVIPFSSRLQSVPPSGSFPMSHLLHQVASSFSFSISSSNEYSGLISLELIGLISSLSKGFSGVFSSITVGKHQFFGTQP